MVHEDQTEHEECQEQEKDDQFPPPKGETHPGPVVDFLFDDFGDSGDCIFGSVEFAELLDVEQTLALAIYQISVVDLHYSFYELCFNCFVL